MFIVLSSVGASNFICPSPCSCFSDDDNENGALLDCSNQNLTDAAASEILTNYFRSTLKANALTYLKLNGNQLTRIPDEVKLFRQLRDVSFYLNPIKTIHSGAFKFAAPVGLLQLDNMKVESIEPGAFQGT